MWHVDGCHQDRRIHAGFDFRLVKCRSNTDEQAMPVIAAQHAGEGWHRRGERLENAPSFSHSDQAAVGDVRDPHGAFGVETDSIGNDIGPGDDFADIR